MSPTRDRLVFPAVLVAEGAHRSPTIAEIWWTFEQLKEVLSKSKCGIMIDAVAPVEASSPFVITLRMVDS